MTVSYHVIELVKARISNEFLTASDTDAARALELSRKAISSYKAGRDVMSPQTLDRAQAILNLPAEELADVQLSLAQESVPGASRVWDAMRVVLNRAKRFTAAIVAVTLIAFGPMFSDSSQAAVSEPRYTLCEAVARRRRFKTLKRRRALRDFYRSILSTTGDSYGRQIRDHASLRLRAVQSQVSHVQSAFELREVLPGVRQGISAQPSYDVSRPIEERLRCIRARYAAGLFALALSGCATLQNPAELSWQALHVADIAMTDHIVGSDCYDEGAPLTRALIGANPSHAAVAAWGIGTAALHLAVSDWLIDDHPTAFAVWQVITIGDTVGSLYKGFSIGVRIGSPNTHQDCGTAHGSGH